MKLYALRFWCKNLGINVGLEMYFFDLGPILGPILAKFPKVESQKNVFWPYTGQKWRKNENFAGV